METNKVEIKKTEIKRMEPDLKLINMETVEVEQIKWLFYPFIPFGKVTIIQGDPGEGKTTMVLQVIAKLTKGEEILPRKENTAEVKDRAETAADSDVKLSESPIEPVNVIYSIAETAKANSLKPYDYFVYLLEEIPKHMDQEDRTFLEDLLPWSEKLPEEIRKQP